MKNINTLNAMAAALAATALFGGAASAQTTRYYDSAPAYVQNNPANFGVIEAIDRTRAESDNSGRKVAGTILGGVVGGVLGHQIGSGRGNDVATVAGALGGAAVGHNIAENRANNGGSDGYRVTVRLDSGDRRTFWRNDVGDLAVGERVQIDNERLLRLSDTRYEDRRYGDDRRYSDDRRVYDDRRVVAAPESYRYDARGNRIVEEPAVRYQQARADNRVYRYDAQGYRVDQFGNRYDEEGYWVDERGIRHEYQDPPLN